MEKNKPVILFIPEAGIYPYLRGLSVLGDAISKNGGKVLVTKCTGQMKRCIMMDMNNCPIDVSEEEKAKLCKKCSNMFCQAKKKYNFEEIDLSELVDEEMENEISDILKDVSTEEKQNINYMGFPVGKAAQFDFTLMTKYLYGPELGEHHQKIYDTYIKNIAFTTALAKKICKRYDPELLLTFGEYAQYQGARHATILENVKRKAMIYPMHFNADCSRFIIWKNTNEAFFYPHCQRWNDYKNICISSKHVRECWDDAYFRLFTAGSHIFSPRKAEDPEVIFKKLNLDEKKKTIVVYTSSYDERYVKNIVMDIWKEGPEIIDAFPDQISWLKMLRSYVSYRDDVQIIVRVHPREGSRQFGFDSQHLKQLKKEFSEESSNFTIIWPDDQTSSYDILELADVCLVPWTLMGQEAVRLGIPVLSSTGNMFYPNDDFIQVAIDPEDYKRKLDEIIEMRFTWKHLVKAVRYYHWRAFAPALDLSETVPKDFSDSNIWPEVPDNMSKVINDVLMDKSDLIEYNIENWTKNLPEDAEEQERKEMMRGIRYLLDAFFYPPKLTRELSKAEHVINYFWRAFVKKNLFNKKIIKEKLFSDYVLRFSDNVTEIDRFVKETKNNKLLRILVADGMHAILINNGKTIKRMSPVAIRLARLHESVEHKYNEK